MTGLKLITFDLDNTLWPVDEVIRQAEKTCSDWIAGSETRGAAQSDVHCKDTNEIMK